MNIAIIGLSSFGTYLCKYLAEMPRIQVMAIDLDENAINRVKDDVKKAVVANATDKETLKKLEIQSFDRVVISVGEPIDASILITLYLKEFGVKSIIAKAVTEDHAKILSKLGASTVIFPEKDMAKRVTHTLCHKNLFDYISLGDGNYSLIEIAPPDSWQGKTLMNLNVRKKYNVQVIMIKDVLYNHSVMIPEGDYIVKESDILVILGKSQDLEKVENL